MKAVMLEVDAALLEQRRRLGLDRWDEMWEGVLHMTPAPSNEHQRLLDELLFFLMSILRRTGYSARASLVRREQARARRIPWTGRGTVRSGINVFDESSSTETYRIPDLTFIAAGREALFAPDGIRGGGPDAVVEIRSPSDETHEKLPFFARLRVREVVVIDRDTKGVEIFALTGDRYEPRLPDSGGSLVAEVLGVRFRVLSEAQPRLFVAETGAPGVSAEI